MEYDFDKLVDRYGTNCGKWEFMPIQNKHAGISTLPFWVADMDIPCPDGVIQALHQRVDRQIFGYSVNYTGEFFRSICGWFQHRFDWYVNSADVFYCNGIVPAIYYLIQMMTHEGDQILLQPPIYRPFYKKIQCAHRIPVENQLIVKDGTYAIDFEDFEKKVKDPKTTLFLLCSPHNPTGRVWTEYELERMCKLCMDNGVRIVADEIHHDIVAPGIKHVPMEKLLPQYKEKIITCTSVSKTFNLAGLAYSNIIIHDPHLQSLWIKLVQEDYGVRLPNPLSITAIEAAYATGEPWLDQLNGYLHHNLVFVKEYLAKHLPLAKMEIPEGTYFAWIHIGPYLVGDAKEDIDTYLVKQADILMEGHPTFGPGGENYIRVNAACPRSRLAEGIARMCVALGRIVKGEVLEDTIVETPWKTETLSQAVNGPTAIFFLRYYGCTICQLDLRRLREHYGELTEAGIKAIVVLQSDPALIREQISCDEFPFSIICDPNEVLYQRYRVAPALSKEKMADANVIQKIGKARQLGLTHGKYEGNELQLPAVFLVDQELTVLHAHYGTTPADVPAVRQVIDWFQEKEEK